MCLDQRFAEARAFVELLVHADAALVDRSVVAVGGLTPLADCADRAALTAMVALPGDASVRAEIGRVGERLAAVRALRSSGGWKDALAQIKDVTAAATALHHDPLLAEALYEQANLENRNGDNTGAESDLLAALTAADRGGHDQFRAKAYVQLIYIVGVIGHRISEGRLYARLGEAAVARLGDPPELRADLLSQHGNLTAIEEPAKALPMLAEAVALKERAYGAGDADVAIARVNLGLSYFNNNQYDVARQQLTLARDQLVTALGAEHPTVVYALMGLGNLALDEGKLDEAQANYEQALAIRERVLGKDSADLGGLTHNLAYVMTQRGRWADALAMDRRALVLMEKKYGAENPVLGAPLTTIGEALLELRDPAGALPALERAWTLRSREGVTVSDRSRTAFNLARALWDGGGDRKRARSLAVQARTGWTSTGETSGVELADTWLAAHH
jgi:tetratricopeptide (TPR) repeat protein